MKYCADHRPYFTIHDSEFKEYTTDAPSPPAVILGVTNPFFAKTLQHWPHIIRITNGSSMGEFSNEKLFLESDLINERLNVILINCLLYHFFIENHKYRIKKSENLKVLDSKPGVYTQYKPFLHKDKTILKKLLRGIQTKRPGEVQTALLRRHLLELTESFMIPLERYIASLMPLQKNISPFKVSFIIPNESLNSSSKSLKFFSGYTDTSAL